MTLMSFAALHPLTRAAADALVRIRHEREVPPRLANVGYRGVKRKEYAQDEFFSS
jgi:hypothetical protein